MCTVFRTKVIARTKQSVGKILFILWQSPLFSLLFLANGSTKESKFDWFNLCSPLFQ